MIAVRTPEAAAAGLAGGAPPGPARGARLAWVGKAPAILREDAEKFLEWCQRKHSPAQEKATSPLEQAPPALSQTHRRS
jgi:hypothetical protein